MYKQDNSTHAILNVYSYSYTNNEAHRKKVFMQEVTS